MKIREDYLPLNRPSIGDREIIAVINCLKSKWITTGPLCKTFEERFQTMTGARHAVSVVSATAGMHLALMALGIGQGDEVITPSMTFASTINMIALLGARPVFSDVHYDTLNMNADHIESLITSRTRAIIPVHFAGAPADMNRIMEIADRHRPGRHRRRRSCRRYTLPGNACRRFWRDSRLFFSSFEKHHDRRRRNDHP